MSREIKFRGRRIDNGEWVYGCLTRYSEAMSYITCDVLLNECYKVDAATVGQFTGLKDSEDKEIYEGDTVCFTYWWFNGNEAESELTGEIVYEPEHMSFALKGIKNKDWLRHIGGDNNEDQDTAAFAFFNFSESDFLVTGHIPKDAVI